MNFGFLRRLRERTIIRIRIAPVFPRPMGEGKGEGSERNAN